MDGILNIYKEAGFTSHDVVAKLRGILHQKKIGHTGTLDPQAVGVLPVCLGKGTRLCDMLTEKEKTYEVVLHLGISTDTQDMTGKKIKECPVLATQAEIEQVIHSFLGDQMQIPPMYSALKVNGKKLYELAREGKTIERKPRPVTFYAIHILEWNLPYIRMEVTCSKGTYIRTLCHDIGEKLGCGGCMEALKRTRVGRFSVHESLTLSQIEQLVQEGTVTDAVCSVESVFEDNPKIQTKDDAGDKLLHNGNPLDRTMVEYKECKGWLRTYDNVGSFVGIYQWKTDRDKFFPVKMFY